MRLIRNLPRLLAFGLLAACSGLAPARSVGISGSRAATSSPIRHVIVLYLENRSFDNLFGLFPGADGIADSGNSAVQTDTEGRPYTVLPALPSRPLDATKPVTRLPADLPNRPFDLAPFVPMDQTINLAAADSANNFYQEEAAIDGGKMDRFAAVGTSITMGYYDGSSLSMWKYAQQYVLADHFFHAAFGGSGLNHFWLFCACTPIWRDASSYLRAELADDGSLIRNGLVTPDGYLVNNIPSRDIAKLVPLQSQPDIGDRLDAGRVSWAWYTAGWRLQQYPSVFAPFLFFRNTAPGTPGAATHLKDETEFFSALDGPDLPSVVVVKPALNEHPVTGSGLLAGDQHAAELVKAVQQSRYWESSAIIVTYDEGSGLWDHVAPPKSDRWGPGSRVPTIIISPYAKRGFVDETTYDTTSILRFIEWNWSLPPLGNRDAHANNLLNAFDFVHHR